MSIIGYNKNQIPLNGFLGKLAFLDEAPPDAIYTSNTGDNIPLLSGVNNWSNNQVIIGSVTANTFSSTVATGTAPLTIKSTTLIANLNSDLLDGNHVGTSGAAIPLLNGVNTWSNNQVIIGSVTANTFSSTVATGTAPLTVSSTTLVTNLNADLLDGYHVGTSGSTIPRLDTNNIWSATQSLIIPDAGPQYFITNSTATAARYPGLVITNYSDTQSSGHAVVELRRFRGNTTTQASVQTGDILGGFNTWGSNTTAILSATRIEGYATNTFSTAISAGLRFNTTFNGSQATRLTINDNGDVIFANTINGNGAGLTTLNAANVSSGTLSTARLGSGTANANTVLYGDNTWKSIISGASITNDITTNANYYPMWATVTTGTPTVVYTSNTKLYFNPSTGTLNATIFNSLSDSNQKTDIKLINNAQDIINKIEGVEFTWIDNGKKSAGVIAQELEKILPDLVDTNENSIKSVNYNGIIAYLIQTVKELDLRIKTLENK